MNKKELKKFKEFIEDIKIKILNKSQFLGHLFYNMEVKSSEKIDTLAVYFDNKRLQFIMLINLNFFNKLNDLEKIAVIEHELYHIYFQHFERVKNIKDINWNIANIAMDIAINQYIENLPKNALFPETFNLPKNLNFEEYYELLNNGNKDISNQLNNIFDDKNDLNDNKSYNNNSNDNNSCNNNSYSSLDNHKWFEKVYNDNNIINDEKNADIIRDKKEEEKEIFKSYIKNLFKEMLNKTKQHEKTFGYNNEIDKIIEEKVEEYLNKLKKVKTYDIKYIIKLWIEKIVLSNFYKTSWKYPNRRFENMKGKKREKIRKFIIAIDTSASINEDELEYFLNIIYNTIDKIYDNIILILFNQTVYYELKIDRKFNIKEVIKNIKEGGTDIQKVFDFVKMKKFKHLIILTDGETKYPLKTYNIKTIWIYNNLEEVIKNKKIIITNTNILKKNPFYLEKEDL